MCLFQVSVQWVLKERDALIDTIRDKVTDQLL